MSWPDALLAVALLAATAVSVAAVAVRTASRLAPGDDEGLDRSLIVAVAALGQLVGVPTALAALGVLSRWSIPVAHVALAMTVLRRWPAPEEGVRWTPRGSGPGVVVAALGSAVAALAACIGLHGSSAEVDTMHYHVPNAAWLLRSGTLWRLGPSTPGYFTNTYPANGELVGTWLMSATRDDRLVYLAPVLFGVLCVLGTAVLARELGGRPWVGALAGLAVVASPISFHTQTHSLMIDLLVGGGVVSGLALGLRARRLASSQSTLLLGGVAIGLAIGAKQTGLGPGLAAIVAIALLQPRARVRAAVTLVLGAAAFSAAWFARLVVTTGNPLFPKTVAVGGHTLLRGGDGPLVSLETPLLAHLVAGRAGPLETWVRQGARLFGPAVVLPLASVPLVAAAWWRRRPARDDGDRDGTSASLAVCAVVAASFVFYLATPYTGGGPTGVAFLIASQLRYALPFALCGAALAAARVRWPIVAAISGIALAFDALQIVRGPDFRNDVNPRAMDVAAAIVAAVLVVLVARRHALVTALSSRGARVATIAAPSAAIAAAAALIVLPGPPRGDPVARALRAGGDPHGTVLLVGVNDVREMLGPRFDNRIVTLPGGGPSNGNVVHDAGRFTRLVERVDPAVIVVGPVPDTSPAAWTPPRQWEHVGDAGANRLYTRRSLSTLAVAGDSAPSQRSP
jgi:hypothetical protein